MFSGTAYWILFSITFFSMQVNFVSPQSQEEGIVSYEGAQVWRTTLRKSRDFLLIKKLVDNQEISIWDLTPSRADFLVQADSKLKVHRYLNSRKLNHTVLIMDVQRRVHEQRVNSELWTETALRVGHRLNWKSYPTMKIIEEYVNNIAENYPSICKVQNIGHSFENRTLRMVSISNGNPGNKKILITSGIHAREWVAITSALYILDDIVTKFDQQPGYIRNKDWNIIPLLNPDGFEYSHTHDRLWRKNRRKITRCKGVDLNRNFNKDWHIVGIMNRNECQEDYSGQSPFSEPESVALREVILKSPKKPNAFVDIHSYGQLILHPWSAKPDVIKDIEKHKVTANGMSEAIYNTTKYRYKHGSVYHAMYPATGSALDWVYSSGVSQAFTIEARDNGHYGFLLPPEYIEENGKELLGAVKYLAKDLDLYFTRGSYDKSWF